MIGFFDSGVGGLTIEQEVKKRLPEYGTMYLGDSARAPYGVRTHDELVVFAWEGIQWLFARGAELVIIACNSASASALREIQQTKLGKNPARRVLGVIRPTVEELATRDYKDIAVLSTQATKNSQAYVHEFAKLNANIQVTSFACPLWAAMVEQGKAGTEEMRIQIEQDLRALRAIDPHPEAVLLACTHYPYVKKDVEEVLGSAIPVFDQGALVAASLEDYLHRHVELEKKLDRSGHASYFTTGDPLLSTKIAREAFGFSMTFQKTTLS